MGLDMYLTGKRYISSVFRKEDAEIAAHIQRHFPELANRAGRWGDASCVKQIEIDAGYWRKANAIHDWFVREVQGGDDNCGHYYVDREQLVALRDLCRQVLADRSLASELLPTTQGFFFGSTDYDDWYFSDLEATIRIVDSALELPDTWDFEYHSSW